MGAARKYFRKEFQVQMLLLEHESPADFYVSSFQVNRSAVPLLCIRTIIFLGCLSILISSIVVTTPLMRAFWLLYLTQWGVILMTVTSGFATAVSFSAYFTGPIEGAFGLPWYVKVYWVFYNVTVPLAFFITVFYWIFLAGLEIITEEEFVLDPVMDVFVHAVNSVLMLALLVVSRHPSRMLHFFHPVCAALIYLVFTIIYYYAGGLNGQGDVYIYPMLDWSNPGIAAITAVASALAIIIMHVIVVLLSLGRNALTRRYANNSRSLSISNAVY